MTLTPEDLARIAASQRQANERAMQLLAEEMPMTVLPFKRNGHGHGHAPELPPVEAYAEHDAPRETTEKAPIERQPAIEFRHIAEIVAEKREADWLLDDILEARVLAVLAGQRSTFKSFVALDWAFRIALTGKPVVILSGEGAGLDRRVDAWMRTHAPDTDIRTVPVYALERAINLTMATDMELLAAATDRMTDRPVLFVIDTLSKFSAGMDENDNSEVSAYLARLSLLIREAYQATVLLVAHSGHAATDRPRGASSLMANPDAEYIVKRASPVAMVVNVSRDRFKDSPAMPVLGYEAQVINLGRLDKRGQPVTSLALVSTEALIEQPGRKGGINQERARTALREMLRCNPDLNFISSIDLKSLLQAQGINHKRRAEVITWLVAAGILTPSIGGHSIDPTNL